jgi:(p)ppGpp synthase/HD superfamily hydrolase
MESLASKLKRARDFASIAHGDQRYDHRPYTAHLDEVREVAFEFGVTDEDVLIATLLHDSIEDTPTTPEQVTAQFGDRVASLVQAVTNEPGKNRKERNVKTYPKIRSTPGAVTLKMCDRIANVRNCWMTAQKLGSDKKNKSLLGMYKSEYGAFRKALKEDNVSETDQKLWAELDRLLAWIL